MTEGDVTLFVEPVEWPDPVVKFHNGEEQLWGLGIRASTYAEVYRDDMIRKYTRGECHTHATAAVGLHGGELLALMWEGLVVHVFSLHKEEDFLFTRDVLGDMAWPEDWEFSAADFEDYSQQHLLGCPIDTVILAQADPWTLPCSPPEAGEISEASHLGSVLAPIGERCTFPDEDELLPGP